MIIVIPGSLVLSVSPALAANAPGAVGAQAEASASTTLAAASEVMTAAQQMLRLTTYSAQTRDMRGVEPSMYQGRFFQASIETKRRCIAERESEGQYDVVSRNGYYGAYQMSPALARGATWMMSREHRVILGDQAAVRVLAKLRDTPLSEWPRYWQDAAFSTIYNWRGTGSGAAHWRGGRWHC